MNIGKCLFRQMLKYFISCFLLYCLLFAEAPTSVYCGDEDIPPYHVVERILTGVPEVRKYINLEIKLEKIGTRLYNLPPNQRDDALESIMKNKKVQKIMAKCKEYDERLTDCLESIYRSADGTCNNLQNPKWGSAIIEQDRFLPPAYEGIYEIRKSVNGEDLPSARNISLKLGEKHNPSFILSTLFNFFGQFIAHDLTLTPVLTGTGNCCYTPPSKKAVCAPIYLPKEDPFYSQHYQTCQTLIRASPYPKCNFGKRVPINKKTSFLDLSQRYGNSEDESQSLRTLDGSGKLKSQVTPAGELMSKNTEEGKAFCPINETENCFIGGDERVNQHTSLMAVQTIFLRFHNLIAERLQWLNPWWDGERIYQETRRIVIAIYQLIIYKEYLPYLIGLRSMQNFDLDSKFDSHSFYNDQVNPGVLVEYSTAAGRLHSMISKRISQMYPDFKFDMSYSNVHYLHEGKLETLLAGASDEPSEKNDPYFIKDVSNNLYKAPGASFGIDLVSLDIQRGRDVGLPPYVDVVRKCSKSLVNILDFSDLNRLMPADHVEFFQTVYSDVKDIDLWVALAFENHVRGGAIGPTAACIISYQFYRLKFGDSFFVTHLNGRHPFTRTQLQTLHSYTLAHLLCETTQSVIVQKHPLLLHNEENPKMLCESFPPIDLRAWKDKLNS